MSEVPTITTRAPPAGSRATDTHNETTLTKLARALEADLHSGTAHDPVLELALLGSIHARLAHSQSAPLLSRCRAALSQGALRKVKDFIHTHLATQFNIDDIAHAACLSTHHLGRAWHQTTGLSLWQYVLQCRVALACSLISQNPETQLGDIAAQSGFESYSQFIVAFRKRHGVTPGDWRRLRN